MEGGNRLKACTPDMQLQDELKSRGPFLRRGPDGTEHGLIHFHMMLMQRTVHARQNLAEISSWSDKNSDTFARHCENPNGIFRIRLWGIREMKMNKEKQCCC